MMNLSHSLDPSRVPSSASSDVKAPCGSNRLPSAASRQAQGLSRRGVLAVGALALPAALTGCSQLGLGGRNSRRNDRRFAEFTEHVPSRLSPNTEVTKIARFMPRLHLTGGHYVAQAQQQPREMLPYPDRPTWIHAVLEVEDADAQALADASEGAAKLLPPVYPPLRDFVPQNAQFKQVAPPEADRLLKVTEADLGPSEFGLRTDHVAVCAEQRLVILTGLLPHS